MLSWEMVINDFVKVYSLHGRYAIRKGVVRIVKCQICTYVAHSRNLPLMR